MAQTQKPILILQIASSPDEFVHGHIRRCEKLAMEPTQAWAMKVSFSKKSWNSGIPKSLRPASYTH